MASQKAYEVSSYSNTKVISTFPKIDDKNSPCAVQRYLSAGAIFYISYDHKEKVELEKKQVFFLNPPS